MLSTKEQLELDRLEKRFQKNRLANTVKPEAIAPKPEAKTSDQTAVHVHLPESFKIDTGKSTEQPRPVVLDPVPAPRRWVFEHKYDEHGRLVKTTATAS